MNSTMEKILSSQASNWREGRRLRAFELKEQGWKQKHIAQALGVTEGAVSQWMKRAREQGVEGLRHNPPPGATPRLSEDQRARVPELLAQGAQAHGFRGEAWTCERVAIVIRREFGVSYHPAHVSRLLKALRHSLQKPQRRANQREEPSRRWSLRTTAREALGQSTQACSVPRPSPASARPLSLRARWTCSAPTIRPSTRRRD